MRGGAGAWLCLVRQGGRGPAGCARLTGRGCSPPSEEALRAWLLLRDVDVSEWGSGPYKSVRDLYHEVPDGQ